MSHVTLAASERAFKKAFTLVRDNFSFTKSDTVSFGPFSASYDVGVKLTGGTVDLRSDGSVEIKHVDIVWNPLKLKVCFNLPGFTIPGICIVPDPWNGCLVGIPDIPIGGPICIPLDLSGLVSEINTVRAHLNPVYFIDPLRDASWSDLEAELNGKPNQWQIFIDPDFISLDPIDVPASAGNLFENLIENAIENFLPGWLPGWAKDVIMSGLDLVVDGVKALLGVVDTFEDWLGDLFDNQLDLLGFLETALADYFASRYPIFWFPDPSKILSASGGLFRVAIPIRNLKVAVNDVEMIVTADVGA